MISCKKEIMLTGAQPSNNLHIGNYFGLIKNCVEYQDKYDLYIFVADLHALSAAKPDYKNLYENKINLVASYIASGIDFKKTTVFFQSDVYTHTNLMWVFTCCTTMGELYKMTQFKDKTAKVIANNGTEYIPTGLFTYPILMAADILLYNPRYVPVGIDQKQHVELARNIAERFNNKFGKTFKVPEALISEVGAKIMDLVNPEIKMSKSSENGKGTIFLLDAIDDAKKKIMSAKTDSLGKVKYDVKNQPGISNLIVIYSCITKKSIKEIEKKYNNITNYGIFKKDVADAIALFLTNFQKKYNQIIKNKNAMLKELKEAAKKCIKNTENVVNDVYKKIGLNK